MARILTLLSSAGKVYPALTGPLPSIGIDRVCQRDAQFIARSTVIQRGVWRHIYDPPRARVLIFPLDIAQHSIIGTSMWRTCLPHACTHGCIYIPGLHCSTLFAPVFRLIMLYVKHGKYHESVVNKSIQSTWQTQDQQQSFDESSETNRKEAG